MQRAKVFEIRVKVFLLQNIELNNLQIRLSELVDKVFQEDEEWMKFHNQKGFKSYVLSGLYPIEKEQIYKKETIYTVTIRTTKYDLAEYFQKQLPFVYTGFIKALTCEARILPKKFIAEVYNLTPSVMKHEIGYWRGGLKVEDFEKSLKENLIKKYNTQYNVKIDEDFLLYNQISFSNKYPIVTNYKNIRILGDKVCLKIADNEMAQELAYFALGTGIMNMCGRGFGFLNYRWL